MARQDKVNSEAAQGFSPRRVWLVARRDYVGYIKTWGFWISFILPFVFAGLGYFMASSDFDVEPVRYEAILDDTGTYRADIEAISQANFDAMRRKSILQTAELLLSADNIKTLNDTMDNDGVDAGLVFLKSVNPTLHDNLKLPRNKQIFVDPPAATMEAMRPYLRGDSLISVGGKNVALNGVLHIRNTDPVEADYWSRQVNARGVSQLAQRYFRDRAEADYLAEKGLSRDRLNDVRSTALPVTFFDPSKAETADKQDQAVSGKDRYPYLVAMVFSIILWFTVFSGSYMLLTSMLEEKLNKLLEMMLATTRFSEIILGKLIGVAALTITAMLPYICLIVFGIVAVLVSGDAETRDALLSAFTPKLMTFFVIFLILGYVFYGALFIALGAMANSMQDAQTLTTPIMLVLTFSVMVVPIGLNSPDSPLLIFASWFPLSAPFASLMRLPSDPPLWELVVSAGFLALLSVIVIWLAGKMFRYGVLSGGGIKGLLSGLKRASKSK